MWKYFKEGLAGDKRAFVLFDIFEGNICMSLFRTLPGVMTCCSTYEQIKMQITYPIDGIFMQCSKFLKCCPASVQQIIGYPILFWFFMAYLIWYFRNHFENLEEEEGGHQILSVHQYIIGFLAATYILTYFINPGHFDSKEDKEEMKKALENKVELKYNDQILCSECNFPRIARSYHCNICQKCIAKGEYHSSIFNKCIGAGNHPYYLIFIISMTLLFSYQSYYFSVNRIMKKRRVSTLQILLNLRVLVYYFLTFCQHIANIMSNLTFREIYDARKLPYLWKTLKQEYFNPFDKGALSNLREFMLVVTTRKSVPLSETERKEYTTIKEDEERSVIVERSAENQQSDSDSDEEEEQKVSQDQIGDEFDQIGEDKPIPDKYINWLSKKFYTIIDIPNSPIRNIAIQEMRKRMRRQHLRSLSHPLGTRGDNESKGGVLTAEQLNQRRMEIMQKMQKDRDEYMQKQLEIQKVQFEADPEFKKQQKLYIEMSITSAFIQSAQHPEQAEMINQELAIAEKNYKYLFGEEAYTAYRESITNSQSRQQPPPPKYVYQPENNNNSHLAQTINL